MNEEKVILNGKEKDYFEISNSIGEDIVDILRKADELKEICAQKNIPLIVNFVAGKKKFLLHFDII